jgi:hypothetical protein
MQNEGRTNERGFREGNKRIGGVLVEEKNPEEKETRFDLRLRLQVRIRLARRVRVTLWQCAKSQRGRDRADALQALNYRDLPV